MSNSLYASEHNLTDNQDDGTGAPSFVSTSLNDLNSDTSLTPSEAAAREELIIDCASVMYAAGTDSVSISRHS
jgi:hypothetical protein